MGGLSGLAALACLGLPRVGAYRFHGPAATVVLACLFALSQAMVVRFWFRGDTHNFSLAEIPLLAGVVFFSPTALLTARLVGTGAVMVRERKSPTKLVFNLAVFALETAVAVRVWHLGVGSASPVSPRGWLAGAAAVVAADLVSHVAVLAAIRLSSGSLSRASLATVAEVGTVIVLVNAALALVALLVVWVDVRASFILAAVVAAAMVAYRGYSTLRQRYAGLEVLYRFTDALAPVETPMEVVSTLLAEARELLRARRATLVVTEAEGAVVAAMAGDGTFSLEKMPMVPPPLARALLAGSPEVLAAGALAPGSAPSMVAPLRTPSGTDGVMLVGDRLGDPSEFDQEDLRIFGALANHAAVALRNGDLVERLRRQASDSAYRASHDDLTGLGNRILLADRVAALAGGAGPGRLLGIFLMDLDGFKEINDTLGHQVGDVVLRRVADVLSSAVEPGSVVARLGGDEFAVAWTGLRDAHDALAVGRRLQAAVEQPLTIDDVALDVRVSVGAALAPDHGRDVTELLRQADVAMYAAKGRHLGVQIYAHELDTHSARRLALAAELRRSLGAGDLEVHYQPKVSLPDGRVWGVEALVRWRHPRYGMVPPDEFIGTAEASGLIRPLTSYVLTRALADRATWAAAGHDLSVAVNLSARNLGDPGLEDRVAELLARYRTPPAKVTLEVTESLMMTDLSHSLEVLHAFRRRGLAISVDDFGTGYSSLSQLKGLPVSELKIDKSFVKNMSVDPQDAAVVAVTLDLARNFGLSVVAEGVEDMSTCNLLSAMGCGSVQGWLVAKAMPVTELMEWLAGWKGFPVEAASLSAPGTAPGGAPTTAPAAAGPIPVAPARLRVVGEAD